MATITSNRFKYDLSLTSEAYQRIQSADVEWIGTPHYMGLAYFWAYEYRFLLRDTTATKRARVHDALLNASLALDGESALHESIITSIV